ncbi:MAG: FKBP-type peptidyl-prolyl cis-trans isomerase [Candidatus Saccharimonas sp.]|nr:FKBP-type peptidyl-prolyl cis-trans isomerase [Planctomycetaceae bacterium]
MSRQHRPSGLKVTDLTVGTGAVAERGKSVAVHFRCFLRRGDQVADSYEQGEPFRFVVGKRQTIAGFDYGIEGMRVGGTRCIIVSPHLGYRDAILTSIPPNAVLRFEIELLEVGDGDSEALSKK